MTLERVVRFLAPDDEEREPRFREEIERLALAGLRVIAGICIGVPLFMYVLGALLLPSLPGDAMVVSDVTLVLLGALVLALSFRAEVKRYGRALGIFLGAAAAGLESAGMVASADFHGEMLHSSPQEHFPATLSLVMLVGIAALPVKPVHILGLGTAILALFAGLVLFTEGAAGFTGWSVLPFLLSGVTVGIATGLTAVVYRQRATAFFARLQAEESFAELTRAQASLLLERNAAAQSRFVALLSHELNTPIGALSSAFETLVRLVEHVETDSRTQEALADAVRSGRSSFERLNDISRRMRRLTNLDRAESRFADVNELLRDTVSFLENELSNVTVELLLSPLPQVYCRPQQIGAVVSNLIRNAAAATRAGGRIEISSRSDSGAIAVRVKDDGRGIEPERLATLFEPAFGVDRGRVATKNWGLFVSRSIVVEHGGGLAIESDVGRGTTATMTLPLPG